MTTVATRHYRVCGLTVAAGFDLPGAMELDPLTHPPDAFVERGPVPAELPGGVHHGPTWQVAAGRVLLNIPGVARFLMTEGRQVAFEPEAGLRDEDLAIFLMGSAIGALLHQRGLFVLHGSSVAVDGGAVAFCGPSGAGKSSLVAALCASGRPLVSDDVCVIDFDKESQALATPDGRRLKLWADSVGELSLTSRQGRAVRDGVEKFWVDPPTPSLAEPIPLKAIYFLAEAKPPLVEGIEELDLLHAVELLRANAYRPRLVRALNQEGVWLNSCVALLRGAKAYRLTREKTFESMPRLLTKLEDHWREVF